MAAASIGTAQIQSLAVTDAKVNDLSVAKLSAGVATFTGTVTFQQSGGGQYVDITSSGVTIANGSNIVTISSTGVAVQAGSTNYMQVTASAITFTLGGSLVGSFGSTGLSTAFNVGCNTLNVVTIAINPATTASTATGGAGTLPANPVGFFEISIAPGGIPSTVKVPYYNI